MCGRYGYIPPSSNRLQVRYKLSQPPLFPANYNAAPSQKHPVIVRNSPNRLTLMEWGLVPYHSLSGKAPTFRSINARAETIVFKPVFRDALKARRCLVVASFFYEWKVDVLGGRPIKTPHLIYVKGQKVFSMAGIYSRWESPAGNLTLDTFAIVTTQPNSLMAPIHDRMPVILIPDGEDAWLDPTTPSEQLLALLVPYPADQMTAYPVSKAVGNPQNNTPDLIQPIHQVASYPAKGTSTPTSTPSSLP